MSLKHAELRVSGQTIPAKLAGAIVKTLNEGTPIKMVAIGADANNSSTKGMIVANSYLATSGRKLDITPAFGDVLTEEGREVTAISWFLKLSYI